MNVHRGAYEVTWLKGDSRPVLREIFLNNPRAGEAELWELFYLRVRNDEAVVEAALRYAFQNALRKLIKAEEDERDEERIEHEVARRLASIQAGGSRDAMTVTVEKTQTTVVGVELGSDPEPEDGADDDADTLDGADADIEAWWAERSATPPPSSEPPPSAAAKAMVEEVEEKIEKRLEYEVSVRLLDLRMPNNKRLRDCTGPDCARFGSWFKRIARAVPKGKTVGQVLTEDQVYALRRAAQK